MELELTVCFPLVGRHNETPEHLEVELMSLHCEETLKETFLK